MSKQASFTLRGRNPDVLTCIANLSNDEVFTTPEFANRMLNTLAEAWAKENKGANIWSNSSIKFLDPCTKTGVFLREITKRLTKGLEDEIPNLNSRVDHILSKQIYGIGITHLTSLIARRSIYCSKNARGPHSIARSFKGDDGNIWFKRTEHEWNGDVCGYCGASKKVLGRGEDAETHAYAFIHTDSIKSKIEKIFGGKMQFDVIVGNPPYQLQDGGHAASATPIYQKFVEQAMNLEPRYLVMVTPSRWFQGGRGLSEFRSKMLNDNRVRTIVDFIRDKDAFPNINVNGGVNYFLWSRDGLGDCEIKTVDEEGRVGTPVHRALNEFDVFVRRNEALPILRKILSKKEGSFSVRVSALKPFGLRTHFHGRSEKSSSANIKLYGSGAVSWVSISEIPNNVNWIQKWKVLVPAATDGNETYPLPIWDKTGPFVAGPGEACTETYLVASLAKNKSEAESIVAFMRTKFFRFLVSLRKIAQHNKAENFLFVPDITLDKTWTDSLLMKKFGISSEESAFVDSMIRSVEWGSE